MAIRVRRGNEADFDVNKMLPGEWAVSLDTKYVRMCFAPGVCLRMATYETFESDMERIESILAEVESIDEAIKAIYNEVNANANIVVEQTELAKEYARQAKESADRAAEVADIGYGSSDRAGIVAPQDIYVDPSNGHMELIATASASPLQNSYDGGLRFTEMIGASEQNTTTGKNLLNVNREESASCNVKMTNNNDGTVTLSGTATGNAYVSALKQDINLPLGSYIFSGVPVNNLNIKFILYEYDSSNTFVTSYQDTGNGVKVNVTDTTHLFRPQFVVVKDTVVPNLVCYPMLRLEDTDSTFEPYTGGKASPNPDYPQEIKSVSISGMKTHGKNLLKNEATSNTVYGITLTVNDDGTVKVNGTATDAVYLNVKNDFAFEKDKSYTLSGCPVGGSATTYSIYINGKSSHDYGNGVTYAEKEGSMANVVIVIRKGTTVNNLVFKPMLRYAEITDDTFQPYVESVVTPTGFKLNAIGDVKDRLFKKDGLWQVERKLKEVVFDGSSDEKWNGIYAETSNKLRFTIPLSNCVASDSTVNGGKSLNSHFKLGSNGATYNTQNIYTISTTDLLVTNDKVTTALEFITWLTQSPMTLLYELATPTYEVLPLADQVTLNSLLTFDGTTYLDIESVLEPQFALEYGTSKVGGYTLQSLNTAEANQVRIVAMETIANNLAEAVLQGEE